jgi:hypothetical protein
MRRTGWGEPRRAPIHKGMFRLCFTSVFGAALLFLPAVASHV